MTPEQLETKLNQTADVIEQGLTDIKKNAATKQEVQDLIKEKVGEDSEFIKAAKAESLSMNTKYDEAKQQIDILAGEIKRFRQQAQREMPLQPNGYRGYFPSPHQAKTFAMIVMAAVTAGTRLDARSKQIQKQLEDMGIEPYYVNESGQKTMVGSGQATGALVTVEQIPSILMLLAQYGVYRSDSQQMPMGAGQTTQPKIDGLLTGYVPGEGGTITETTPTIQVVTLTPRTLNFLTGFSMELEDDAFVILGEMLAGLFARSMAYYEDLIGFLGDGTSTYFGMTGITGALLAVSATIASIKSLVVGAGNAYSELTLANFNSVCGIAPEYADDGNLKWYMHRYFYYTVCVALALASSVTATEVLVGAGQKQKMFLGYDVRFTQVMPRTAANSQICALLANLKQGAMLGTRGGIEFASSSERYFEKGIIAVRGRDRIAVNAHGVGNTTDAGPICGLITAAS